MKQDELIPRKQWELRPNSFVIAVGELCLVGPFIIETVSPLGKISTIGYLNFK